MSQIVLDSVIIEGRTRARILWGKLASTYKPGQVVYESSTGIWTTVNSATAAHHLLKFAIIEFKPRTSATFGEVDLDIAYATTDDVPIIVGSYGGDLKLGAFCVNPGEAELFGESYVIGTTAGSLIAETLESTGFAGTGTAIRYSFRCYVAEEGIGNGDTVGVFYYN